MKKIILVFFFIFYTLSLANENTSQDLSEFEDEFEQTSAYDPLSGYNEMMTDFNLGFYRYILRPVSKSYEFITPKPLRIGVKNIFSYILIPMRFVNNLLQFKFQKAGDELKRFAHNTFFGLVIFDTASIAGIPKHPADFGTTLAHWGVGSGFHIVLPVLGPSNVRDALSLPINWYMSPTGYVEPFWLSFAINSYGIINEFSLELDFYDELYYNTPNLYPFLRDAYEKRREVMSQ